MLHEEVEWVLFKKFTEANLRCDILCTKSGTSGIPINPMPEPSTTRVTSREEQGGGITRLGIRCLVESESSVHMLSYYWGVSWRAGEMFCNLTVGGWRRVCLEGAVPRFVLGQESLT